jgi:hypothetical protein
VHLILDIKAGAGRTNIGTGAASEAAERLCFPEITLKEILKFIFNFLLIKLFGKAGQVFFFFRSRIFSK